MESEYSHSSFLRVRTTREVSGGHSLQHSKHIVVFVAISGIIFSKFPYYQIYLLIGASFTKIGAELLYTMKVAYYAGAYLGYQFVVDIANGLCQQVPLTIVQVFSKPEDLVGYIHVHCSM